MAVEGAPRPPVRRSVWTIVLNWNGAPDTTLCLESLRAVRVPEGVDWTRLVVDNGSTDGSLETLPARFPEVRFHDTGANLRWAGGNNAGLALARAEGADGVLLLNNDTALEPDALAELLSAVDAHPEGGLFGPTILSWDGARIWSAGGDFWPALGWSAHRGLGRRWDPAGTRPLGEAEPAGYLTGAALYATRACLEAIGGLDERYYLYGEDADWCLRARAAGFACLYAPRAVLRHRVSGSSGAASPFKAYHRTRAGLRLAGRHARGLARWTWPVAYPVLLLAQSAAWAARGGGLPAFRAAWQAWFDHGRGIAPGDSGFVPRREQA
ncbi:MAG: glycosyltransferase family 2 protein [Candidatus Eisenbacteria bacterium]